MTRSEANNYTKVGEGGDEVSKAEEIPAGGQVHVYMEPGEGVGAGGGQVLQQPHVSRVHLTSAGLVVETDFKGKFSRILYKKVASQRFIKTKIENATHKALTGSRTDILWVIGRFKYSTNMELDNREFKKTGL